MMRRANQRWMAIALPVGAGSAILALGLFLMPSAREVEQAERRGADRFVPISQEAGRFEQLERIRIGNQFPDGCFACFGILRPEFSKNSESPDPLVSCSFYIEGYDLGYALPPIGDGDR